MKNNWFHTLCKSLGLFRDELKLLALRIWYWPEHPPKDGGL